MNYNGQQTMLVVDVDTERICVCIELKLENKYVISTDY